MLILFHDILLLKVLVVSDIKKELGYIGSPVGHKEWRRVKQLVFYIPQLSYFVCWLFWNFLIALFPEQLCCQVCSRLKAAQIVEEFQAKVNEKVTLKSCVNFFFLFGCIFQCNFLTLLLLSLSLLLAQFLLHLSCFSFCNACEIFCYCFNMSGVAFFLSF